MTSIELLHRHALDATGRTVAGIRPDQLSAPTPDAEWDVRALLNHVVAGNLWAAELGSGKTIEAVGDRLDGDGLGDDPTAADDASAKGAAGGFGAPGAPGGPWGVAYGPGPGLGGAGHRV